MRIANVMWRSEDGDGSGEEESLELGGRGAILDIDRQRFIAGGGLLGLLV